jgi:hypothetical protein
MWLAVTVLMQTIGGIGKWLVRAIMFHTAAPLIVRYFGILANVQLQGEKASSAFVIFTTNPVL